MINLRVSILTSSLYRNALYLILNSVVNSLLGFAFWNVMAKYFPPEQVGIGSALLASSSLISAVSNLGLGVGLIRFIPEAGKKAAYLINNVFTLVLIITSIVAFVYLTGIDRWSPSLKFIHGNLLFFSFFILFTVVTSLSVLIDQSFIAGQSAKYVLWKNIIICIVKIPLPVFVFAYLRGFGIFAGTGAATLMGTIVSLFCFLPLVYKGYFPRPAWAGNLIVRMLPYSFVNYTANLLNSIPAFIYPLMVLNYLGPEKSAYFYIAWMITMVLSVIPAGMAQSLFAEGSHDQRKINKDGRQALGFTLMLSLPAVVAMWLLGRWLLYFFGPGYASNGIGVLRFLVLAVIPQCINALFISINQVEKRIYLIIAQTGIFSTIALGAGYWLLTKFGLNGIGMAYALAHFLVAAAVVWPLLKALNERQREEKARLS